jgi:hypothetical protein
MEGITKHHRTAALLLAASALILYGCDGRNSPTSAAAPDAMAANQPGSITTASEAEQQSLVDREQELTQREAELAQQKKAVDAEIARRDAQIAAATTEARNARLAADRAARSAQSSAARFEQAEPAEVLADADEAYAPAAQDRMSVPAGTSLEIALGTELDTRKVHVGDAVEGTLASPIVVGASRAVEPGARIHGTVTEVVSGGARIGGVPTLGLAFDSITVEDGSRVPISAHFLQQAKSDTGKDAAKILGGAAAGAVVGHQVKKDDKGTIIGGILGGAAGAAAAKNTGGEVSLPAGTVISVTTDSSFQVER